MPAISAALAYYDGYRSARLPANLLQAQREVGIQGEIGGRHPAHATGLGKVLLAALDDEGYRAEIALRMGEGCTW